MTQFVYTKLVQEPALRDIVTAALGASPAAKFSSADEGKAVKLGTANNYVPVADGNDIEGFVAALAVETVNDGYSLGSVQRGGRAEAEVGAFHDGATNSALAVGEFVVADAGQPALGTAGLSKVKRGTPANFKWRVIRIVSGTGTAGSKVILEKV